MELKSLMLKRRRWVLSGAVLFLGAFLFEVLNHVYDLKVFYLSELVLIGSLSFVSLVHFMFSKTKSELTKKVVKSLNKRSLDFEFKTVLNLLTIGLDKVLRSGYVFTPRVSTTEIRKSNLSTHLEKFLKNHKEYSDLNKLDQKEKEVIKECSKLKFSHLEFVTDLVLLSMPYFALNFNLFGSVVLTAIVASVFRVFTVFYYGGIYRSSKHEDFVTSFNKLETFIKGDFEEDGFSTRVDFTSIFEDQAPKVFLLVDEDRKNEMKKALRRSLSLNDDFKHSIVISTESENSSQVTDVTKSIFLFPSELGFSTAELKEFMVGCDKVIVIDVDPLLADEESSVFYLDQDQRIKKVKVLENMERLSGDKGLIIRNLKDQKLEDFLKHVDKELMKSKESYLVFEREPGKLNKNSLIYSSQEQGVRLERAFKSEFEDNLFYKVSSSDGKIKTDEVKNFIANCAYHGVLSNQLKSQNRQVS